MTNSLGGLGAKPPVLVYRVCGFNVLVFSVSMDKLRVNELGVDKWIVSLSNTAHSYHILALVLLKKKEKDDDGVTIVTSCVQWNSKGRVYWHLISNTTQKRLAIPLP